MLLTAVTFLPALGGLVLLLVPRRVAAAFKVGGLVVTLATLLLSVPLYVGFDGDVADFQFEEARAWMPDFGISYHLGIDGISLLLVLLTTFLMPVALASAWHAIEDRWKEFVVTMLILETGMLGVFVSLDLFLFYVFWEAMLIPMYFIIGVWGGADRIYAAVKFVLYTMVGSVLMLVAILALYYQHGAATGTYTFDLPALTRWVIPPGLAQNVMFLAFALAFAIKVPLFPFHTWLPDAHVEAPTAGSVILAGVLLKMGTYGFLRFCLPLFPDASLWFGPLVFALAVIGIVYGAWVSTVQPDMKKLVCLVPPGRHDLRAPPHTPDRRLRRPLERGARLLGAVHGRRPVVARAAGAQRVRGRVPRPGRGVPDEPVARRGRHERHRLRGGLPALDVPAGDLRRGHPPGEPLPSRPLAPRVGPARARRGLDRLDRRLPDGLHRQDRGDARGADRPGAGEGERGPVTADLVFPVVLLGPLLPTLIVLAAGALVLLLDLLPLHQARELIGPVALAGVVGALLATLARWGTPGRAFSDMVVLDNFALFVNVVICYAAALILLLSMDYLRRSGAESGEYYALVLFATAGMMLLAAAGDLVVLFLALELMSLSLYVLAGLFTQALASSEASMKYFILGAFASSFLLYGIALMYGATGTTNLDRIAAAAAGRSHAPLFMIGMGLLLVGLGFKTSSVPFHMWVPDVYQGAPTSVTALIATGSKAAAFAALIRVLTVAFRGAQPDWTALLWIVAALTMTVGNVAAIAQSNLKRMLAYSSIAHAGYMLVGLVAGGMSGAGAVLFYLLTYTFTTAGAFGVITLCERARDEAVEVGDYAGLAERHPVLAAALGLFLLSLIGVPPLAGFVGKFYVFAAAVRAGYLWLTVAAVLNSALAAYYYLRVVVYMYMRAPESTPVAYTPSLAGALALVVALVGIVALGVVPAPFVDLAQAAVAPLVR